MGKQHDAKTNLFDILECSKNCLDFTKDLSFEEFEEDIKTTAAILHQIMIIGEAVKRLGTEFTAKHPVLPWSEMAKARDILIHHYDETDLTIVWKIIIDFLPKTVTEIEKLLK